jgi:hypothetical protein
MTEAEARRAARIELGRVEQTKESVRVALVRCESTTHSPISPTRFER